MTTILAVLGVFSSRESSDSHRMSYTALNVAVPADTITTYPDSVTATVTAGDVNRVEWYVAVDDGQNLYFVGADDVAPFVLSFTDFATVAGWYGALTGTTPVVTFTCDLVAKFIGPGESAWARANFEFQP